jgi:sterol desaturase/sphingolipid hydroxylase (fatty acid hydroxylase superfamily)
MGGFLVSAARNLITPVVQIAWIMPLLLAAELLLPMGKVSPLSRVRGLLFLLLYLIVTAAITVGTRAAVMAMHIGPLFSLHVSEHLGPLGRFAAGASAALFFMFALDFFTYWTHRAQHAWPWLWRFHAVHHSITELSALNAFNHWSEQIMRLPAVTIPMALLIPANLNPLPFVMGLGLIDGYFVHAATRLHFGPLRRVLVDSHMHRIHHSIQPEHFNTNFGVFTTIYDQMFGTAHFPAPGEWPETGVREFPEPLDTAAFLFWPWRRQSSVQKDQIASRA